jgi:hypothetical protein
MVVMMVLMMMMMIMVTMMVVMLVIVMIVDDDGGIIEDSVLFTMLYRLPNIKKLVLTGGRLDDNHLKEIKDVKCGPLTIYGLYGDGYVIIFKYTLFKGPDTPGTIRQRDAIL